MDIYKRILKKPWPYIIGGIILAFLNIFLFLKVGKPWRVTTGFLYWGIAFIQLFGFDLSNWYYFTVYSNGLNAGETFLKNSYTVLNLAVIIGSLIAILMASEFKWKRIKNRKQLIFGFLGGIIMGYGSRISFGCNIGAYFSAIPSLSLHGWVYGIFMFIGAWIGSKLLFKYLL